MSDIYENCPVIENEDFLIRLVNAKDATDLLEVYGDKNALPFFNSDNCNGDNFYCQTKEHMAEAIKFWLWSYFEVKEFVRFSICDKNSSKVVGTIEIFRRMSEDYFNDCGLLRLDLRNDWEEQEKIEKILGMILEPFKKLFDYKMVATKAPVYAVERIQALKKWGFEKSEEALIGGHNGKMYYDYWVLKQD